MRKLIVAGLVAAALGGVAYADDASQKVQDAKADAQKTEADARKDASEAKAKAQKDAAEAQAKADKKASEAHAKAEEKARDARQDSRGGNSENTNTTDARKDPSADPSHAAASGDMGRTSAGSDVGRDPAGVDTRSEQRASGSDDRKHPVFTKSNFDLEGTVQSANRSSLTVKREELPAAKLTIDRNTKVEVDGQKVSAAQLKPGQKVRASFNLQNDKAMAVEVKAEKAEK